jgi:hypothetical protein
MIGQEMVVMGAIDIDRYLLDYTDLSFAFVVSKPAPRSALNGK